MKREIEEVIGLDCSNAILASAKQVSLVHSDLRVYYANFTSMTSALWILWFWNNLAAVAPACDLLWSVMHNQQTCPVNTEACVPVAVTKLVCGS